MSSAEQHRVDAYLIRAFARYLALPTIVYHFREMFGREPTPDEIARCDIGAFIGDKRAVFDKRGTSDSSARVRMFIRERELYNSSVDNIPIHNPTYRMEKYQEILERIYPEALELGKFSRVLEVLTIAAKDGAGGFAASKTVNVDNRSVTINSMPDKELSKRISELIEASFGVKVDDLPIIESGDMVIEHEEE